MNQQVGIGSLCFSKTPFIISTGSVVGKKEGEGPLAACFDVIGTGDEKFGEENWEAAESALQKEALTVTLGKINRHTCPSRSTKTSRLATSFSCTERYIKPR